MMNFIFLITGIIIGFILGFITGMAFYCVNIKKGNLENEGFYWFNPYERGEEE